MLRIGWPQATQPPARAAKTSRFSLRQNARCFAAKPEDSGFAGGIPIPSRCRRCEPWFLAATSLSAIARPQRIRAHATVDLRESHSHCTARCAPSIYCSFLCSRLTVLAPPNGEPLRFTLEKLPATKYPRCVSGDGRFDSGLAPMACRERLTIKWEFCFWTIHLAIIGKTIAR